MSYEQKALEQVIEIKEMENAGWTKMDDLEWKRWGFILVIRSVTALVYAILARD